MVTPFSARLEQVERGSSALRSELKEWCKKCLDDSQWHRHQSQLLKLSADIHNLVDSACYSLKEVSDDTTGWRKLARAERGLLAANHIWDYFRAKYTLRLVPDIGQILRLADDFAWACYRPVQAACSPKNPREPPLVHFSEVWSPYAMARDRSFANELRFAESATAERLLDESFEEVLSSLPVPLVSLPWFQASHVPSLLILAHECGHIVSWDFGLGAELEKRISEASWNAGANDWQRWREEVFADLFGVIAARDGFVAVLINLLAADREYIDGEAVGKGIYPSRNLRIEIALAALDRLDSKSAKTLREFWVAAYPNRASFPDHEADIAQLIDLVMDLSCGNEKLAGLFRFSEGSLNYLRPRAIAGGCLGRPDFDVIGALVLAARIDGGRDDDCDPVIALATIQRFVDQRTTGYRSSGGEGDTPMAAASPSGGSPSGGFGRELWNRLD